MFSRAVSFWRASSSRRALLSALALTGLVILATPAVSGADHEEEPLIIDGFPTVEGAPFVPDPDRAEIVIERAELLQELDELDQADAGLIGRNDAGSTRQVIASRRASIERSLEQLQPAIDELAESTRPFGIEVAAFPVDELRKPFRDDWGEPRSGGRRHAGNDFLAHIGIPLRAIEDGTFQRLSGGALGGLGVVLFGDSGAEYLYVHLDSALPFEDGQRVYAGQIVGTVGDSGNARGAPHLHLQIAPSGEMRWENPHQLMAELFGPLDQSATTGVLGASTTPGITNVIVDNELRDADFSEAPAGDTSFASDAALTEDTALFESRLNQLLTSPAPDSVEGFTSAFGRTVNQSIPIVGLSPLQRLR